MENMKIFVVSHKEVNFPNQKIYIPIQVGNGKSFTEIRDNTGENISPKNKNFCELTAAYWIWKNDNSKIVGITHYRRYFFKNKFSNSINNILDEKDIESILKKYDIIVPEIENIVKYTVEEAYGYYHHINDFNKCRKIINEIYPEYVESFDEVASRKQVYLYNMFIAKKEVFDLYYKWLFDILFELEKRVDGFLSERLFNVWLLKNNNLKIKEMPVYNIEKNVLPQIGIRTLQKILLKIKRGKK